MLACQECILQRRACKAEVLQHPSNLQDASPLQVEPTHAREALFLARDPHHPPVNVRAVQKAVQHHHNHLPASSRQ